MRLARAVLVLLLLGCKTPPAPPEDTLPSCVATLIANPQDARARSLLPSLVKGADDHTMETMRYFHGTGKSMMNYNYPSHRWIHPFLRGLKRVQEGNVVEAEGEFETVRGLALEGPCSDFALVVAEESRIRVEEFRIKRSGK